MNFRESEMGFGGRGTRRASELIRPSRRTRAREGGWERAIYHAVGPGGEKGKGRRVNGTSEAIKAEGTRSKNGHGRCDSRM